MRNGRDPARLNGQGKDVNKAERENPATNNSAPVLIKRNFLTTGQKQILQTIDMEPDGSTRGMVMQRFGLHAGDPRFQWIRSQISRDIDLLLVTGYLKKEGALFNLSDKGLQYLRRSHR